MAGFEQEYMMTYPSTGAGGFPTMMASGNQATGGMYPTQPMQQTGMPGLSEYLSILNKSIPNPLLNAGLQAGGALLGGIAGLFKGESWGDKQAKQLYSMAKNRMGMDVMQPEQYLADYMRAMAPRFNQQADAINRRLNLDSGVAQGEMAFQQQAPIAQFMLGAKQKADEMKFQNDNMLMSLMAQLTGGR